MNKPFLIIAATALLNACASQPASQTSLVASLAVGVQEHVEPLSHMADRLFPRQGPTYAQPSAIEYTSDKALQEGLNMGHYDVVLGLLESLSKEHESDTKYLSLQQIHMHYLVKTEREDLHRIENKKQFFSNTKAVGYVSVGETGRVNDLLIASFPNAYHYQACGTLTACTDMLHADNIDAIATTELTTHDKRITTANFSARGSYGLVLNSLTLNRAERHQLAATLWQRAIADEPKTTQQDLVRVVDTTAVKQQ